MNSQESRVESREPDSPLPEEQPSGGSFWALLALLILAAAVLLMLQGRRPKPPDPYAGLPLPPLEVGGWLNTEKPLKTADLRGKVVLVDYWQSDCGPCLGHMRELVDFNKRYRDHGLVTVGLSPESGPAAERMKNYVEVTDGLNWPIGYDAGLVFDMMGVRGTPTYVLYDRTGRSVWGGHSLNGLEDAAIAALAKQEGVSR